MTEVEQRWQQLRGYYEGFWATWLLHVGRELGLFRSLLDRPERSAESLAQGLGYESDYVEVWCRAAHAYDFLAPGQDETWKVAAGWEPLLSGTGAWGSTYVQLSNRVYETLEAVFRGRALPESSLNLRLHLAEGLKASYRWLWLEWVPSLPELQQKLLSSKRLIEFGCGFGLGLEILRQEYPHLELTGLEWDYDCAREAERVTRAVVVVGLPEETSYRSRFDVAVFHRALALCQEPEVALRKAVDSLRKGGVLVIASESELADAPQQTMRLRLGERFFYQMFHSSNALRSVALDDIEGWLTAWGMRKIHRDDAPIGGSPALVYAKA
ncbi:MAG: methyltransferase domain-containing protein [Candidatus Eremiobacteraeota bacterium]|nr:methyltransferase domain-containing protein [Candidatus Eremiobacteraeota bacterium]MCW5869647.1 methyltransferase domain-containing protein [Candidatus Eremiobacteraeota bacterium]